jgi:hypothetical protein
MLSRKNEQRPVAQTVLVNFRRFRKRDQHGYEPNSFNGYLRNGHFGLGGAQQ